jgi:predicted thioesterase
MDASEIIPLGLSAERILVVSVEQTVGHVLDGMPMVLSTPTMIMEMELAAADAIQHCLSDGWITVGAAVDIRHLAAAPVGATVRTTAKVIKADGRRVTFAVASFDGARKIGEGTHTRGLVNAETFMSRTGTAP